MTKKDFELIHDEVIYTECVRCGYNDDDGDDDTTICPECHHDSLIFETSHENQQCCKCNRYIDPWEDLFYRRTKERYFICEECYNDLP